jgi:hypothetical protein
VTVVGTGQELNVVTTTTIFFIQGIYTYTHEANHVPTGYSVAAIVYFTIHGACNAIAIVESFALLHKYCPKYVCHAQYGCFL